MNVSSQVGETGRYTTHQRDGLHGQRLCRHRTTGVLTYGDAAGNLDEAWELPTSDGGRSSLIRREIGMQLGTATLGTDVANGWVLGIQHGACLRTGNVVW